MRPILALLKRHPLVLVGAITLAATVSTRVDTLPDIRAFDPALLYLVLYFVAAFAWLAFCAGKPRPLFEGIALGVPLLALLAVWRYFFLSGPGVVGGWTMLVFFQFPALHGAGAARSRNLDRQDRGIAEGAAMLGVVAAVAALEYARGISDHDPFSRYQTSAVLASVLPRVFALVLALASALAAGFSALGRVRARRELANASIQIPLTAAECSDLAEVPFFGPGEHPTHALHASAGVGYRSATHAVGYFAA